MTLFTKATKKRAKARIALDGPSGSGKTYTALVAATALVSKYGGRIAVIDTERGSASLYSDKFDFDVLELSSFNPQKYIDSIEAAGKHGYTVVVIDSLSHAWEGEGGALEMVDNIAARSQSKNSYFAWRDVTPLHRKLVDAILQSPCHVIATMRSKTEYVLEQDQRGKQVPHKVGMAPIQRQGIEYEFTIVGDMDLDHKIAVSKSRCDYLADKVESKPGVKFWSLFVDWLDEGEAVVTPVAVTAPVTTQAAQPISDEEQKYFGAPRTTEQSFPTRCASCGELSDNHKPTCATLKNAQPTAQTITAKLARPSADMWKRFTAVHDEAVALGINVPNVNEELITAQELATLGKQLNGAIASKKKLAQLN